MFRRYARLGQRSRLGERPFAGQILEYRAAADDVSARAVAEKGKNEIVVFAMENTGKRTVRGLTQPILDSLGDDPNAVRRPKRDMSKTPIMESGDIFLRGTMAQQDGWQTFGLDNTVTLRHLGLEVLSSYDDAHSCLSELELLDADGNR